VNSLSVHGRMLLGRDLVTGTLVVRDGRIDEILRDPHEAALNMPRPLLDTAIVAPGFIDLQVNGGFGVEVGSDADALRHLAACLPRTGVTAYLPTAITVESDFYPLYWLHASSVPNNHEWMRHVASTGIDTPAATSPRSPCSAANKQTNRAPSHRHSALTVDMRLDVTPLAPQRRPNLAPCHAPRFDSISTLIPSRTRAVTAPPALVSAPSYTTP